MITRHFKTLVFYLLVSHSALVSAGMDSPVLLVAMLEAGASHCGKSSSETASAYAMQYEVWSRDNRTAIAKVRADPEYTRLLDDAMNHFTRLSAPKLNAECGELLSGMKVVTGDYLTQIVLDWERPNQPR